MISHLFFYQLILIALVWLFFMLHNAWPSDRLLEREQPLTPVRPRRQRSNEPTPFAGLTYKPHCALCGHEATHPKLPPPVRPDSMPPPNRRPRTVDTAMHFCPHRNCDYRGWL